MVGVVTVDAENREETLENEPRNEQGKQQVKD